MKGRMLNRDRLAGEETRSSAPSDRTSPVICTGSPVYARVHPFSSAGSTARHTSCPTSALFSVASPDIMTSTTGRSPRSGSGAAS